MKRMKKKFYEKQRREEFYEDEDDEVIETRLLLDKLKGEGRNRRIIDTKGYGVSFFGQNEHQQILYNDTHPQPKTKPKTAVAYVY